MRQLRRALIAPLVLLLVGTSGYVLIEGWSVFDALYMTVITLGTVGFAEVHPLSDPGRAFTMVLVMGGVFSIFYFGSIGVRLVADGELATFWRRRKVQQQLDALTGHIIVCGFGRLGRRVCDEFARRGVPYVAIDHRADAFDGVELPGGLGLHGDATSDALLERAGLGRARALIAALTGDAENLYVTMTARLLSDKLFILSRAESSQAEAKLLRAGATRVVSPYVVTGYRAAQAVLRPEVMEFVEVATGNQHLELEMEQIKVSATSALVGKSLESARVRQAFGVIVVAVRREGGKMIYNPPADQPFQTGDVLIALGARAELAALDTAARGG